MLISTGRKFLIQQGLTRHVVWEYVMHVRDRVMHDRDWYILNILTMGLLLWKQPHLRRTWEKQVSSSPLLNVQQASPAQAASRQSKPWQGQCFHTHDFTNRIKKSHLPIKALTLTRGLASPAFSLSSKKLVARPVFPTLPVRPILDSTWTSYG